MERGRSGYPTSDEEYVPQDIDVTLFRKVESFSFQQEMK